MQDLNASTDGLDLPTQQPEKLKAATATPGPSQEGGPSLIDRMRVEQEKNHLKRFKSGPPRRPVGVPVMCRQPAFDHSTLTKVGHNPFVGPPSLRLYGSQSYVGHVPAATSSAQK